MADHVMIYSGSEEECRALDVPLQKFFTGPRQVLTREGADLPCLELGLVGLLDRMNFHCDTSYVLEPERAALLQTCLTYAHDFGFGYSFLRSRWHMDPYSAMENIRVCQEKDETGRDAAIIDGFIVKKYIRPRRLWDLWSNRVVPTWWACTMPESPMQTYKMVYCDSFFAVSHAWLDESERQAVMTPINNKEWPVPIPKSTTLERIRTELLHHTHVGLEYTWVDVLCLRQKGRDSQEPVRKQEWRLDIPTIGAIYRSAHSMVFYYSGLGRPFQIGNLESERHWVNRAWTLQEISRNERSVVAGMSRSSPRVEYDEANIPDNVRAFGKKVDDLPMPYGANRKFMFFISEMHRRFATSELDKVAGLNYFIITGKKNVSRLPIYNADDDPEDLWWRLVSVLQPNERAEFFFTYPEPGIGRGKGPRWCPSWSQQKKPRNLPRDGYFSLKGVEFDTVRDGYWINRQPVSCEIKGLAEISEASKEETRRWHPEDARSGEVITLGTPDGIAWSAFADHNYPIPDGRYTLLMCDWEKPSALERWMRCVVGQIAEPTLEPFKVFEKVSIIWIEGTENRFLELWDEERQEPIALA
ncbi:hypothetical protein FRB98_001803 [Tulasnella sp. 332]|nr:hypothetical protein FRB98_001803 [Tulasnella sp. 332]